MPEIIKIIGIDPAPAKGTCVFDGIFHHFSHNKLAVYLKEIQSNNRNVLICWDAPLTGPRETKPPFHYPNGEFTTRDIESFFSRKTYGFKVPKGISVRGYTGCPHWAMTKHFLGLPQIGPWDTPLEELPFTLISDNDSSIVNGSYVVEVHPAVAIWLWCSDYDKTAIQNWEYKKSNSCFQKVWECFSKIITSEDLLKGCDLTLADLNPTTDDELDAIISWLLGKLFVESDQKVILLGSGKSGSFLLPNIEKLTIAWKNSDLHHNTNRVS